MPFRPYFLLLWVGLLAFPAYSGCPTAPYALIAEKGPARKLLGAAPAEVIDVESVGPEHDDGRGISPDAERAFHDRQCGRTGISETTKDLTATGKKRPPADPTQKPKSREDMAAVARMINKYKPDFVSVQEMQDVHAFMDMSRRVNEGTAPGIKGDYLPLLIEGNDGRGIDVGVLVRADLPLDYTYVSHRNEPMNNPLYPSVPLAFTRDTTALIACAKDTNVPLFIVLVRALQVEDCQRRGLRGTGPP